MVLSWNTDTATTRNQVPIKHRKKGLIVSYVVNNVVVTEQFTGSNFNLDSSWQRIASYNFVEDEIFTLDNKIYMNLYGKSLFPYDGAVNKSNGYVLPASGYKSTAFISVNPNSAVIYSGSAGGFAANIAFYDKEKRFISSWNSEKEYASQKNVEVAIPDNVYNIRASSSNPEIANVIKKDDAENFLLFMITNYIDNLLKKVPSMSDIEYASNLIDIQYKIAGFMGADGNIVSSSSSFSDVSNLIPIRKGDVFHYIGARASASRCYTILDKNKSTIETDTVSDYYVAKELTISIEQVNAAYVRIENFSPNNPMIVERMTSSYTTAADFAIQID